MIEIKKHSKNDYNNTIRWLSDSCVKVGFGFSRGIDVISHSRWLRSNPSIKLYGIFCNKKHVGNITIIQRSGRIFELQIYIGERAYRGKNFGKIALGKMLAEMPKGAEVYVRCKRSLVDFYLACGFRRRSAFLGVYMLDSIEFVGLVVRGRKNG